MENARIVSVALRRSCAIWAIWLGLLATWAPADEAKAPGPGRPNILFLFTDDQRADTIGALGNPAIQTPNLDRLARSGFAFLDAYCMGGDRPAVCLPSRTMLLSGRSLFHLDQVQPDSPSLPRSLREAGYDTYHHGKRGNTPHEIHKQFDRSRYLANDQKERLSGHPGEEIADAALEFLRDSDRDRSRPFFMYLAFGNPHDPRSINAEYRGRYDEPSMPLPANYRPLHPFDNGELAIRDEALAPWPRTPEIVREHLTDYYGVITYLDMQIGRILAALEEVGQLENTIILFSSDHGLAVGSHGLFGKQNIYEDGMKVPMIFAGPGITGGRSEALVYLHDLFPTLCDLAGAPVPDGLDGRSLAPILRGDAEGVRDDIFLSYRDVQRASRRGDWKLIRYPQINRSQLFNLRDDPHETHDLAGDPRFSKPLEEMTALLRRQQEAFGDTLPLTAERPASAEVDVEALNRVRK